MTGTYAPDKLHLQEAGTEGPLLLCLHGIGSSSAAFEPQLRSLSPHVRVVAWDAPGYGESADPDVALTLDDYADIAAALIRARGGGAHVLGVSWGGVIALRLALRHPELLASLIIADSSPGSGTRPERAAALRERPDELAETGPVTFAERRASRLLSTHAPAQLVQRVTDNMAASVRLPGYRYAAESMAGADLRPELDAIHTPTLVLCGDQDTVTGMDGAQEIAGGVRRSAYVILKDAGHLANQEQPARFNAWVLAHLHICTQ